MRRLRAEILNSRKFGAFQSITLVSPEIIEKWRPTANRRDPALTLGRDDQ